VRELFDHMIRSDVENRYSWWWQAHIGLPM
jgi:hypothetical protein